MSRDRITAMAIAFIIVWLILDAVFGSRYQSAVIGSQKEIIRNQMEIIENISSINQDTFHSNE